MKRIGRVAALSGLLLPLAALSAQVHAAEPAQAASTAEATDEDLLQTRQIFDVRTKMRDGVELSSDVWLPSKEGRYPIILLRTPYLKTMREAEHAQWARYFAQRGYAFVVQDVRGRGDSGGEFDFFFQESDDGYDAIEGLAKESWANGRVCTIGISYWGTVQWLAARRAPPALKCIAPSSPAGRFFDEIPYAGGAFLMQWALSWLNDTSGNISQGANMATLDWERIFAHRPLITMDEAMGRKMRLYREFLQHGSVDDYWRRIILTPEDFRRIDIPVLTVTGWFDGDQTGALHYWNGMERDSPGKPEDRYLVIGPWTHIQSFMGGEKKLGELELGPESIVDTKKLHLKFFDRHLKEEPGAFDRPRVSLYVTGANEWRSFDKYPIDGIKTERMYFSSGGRANTAGGNGALAWQKASRAGFDSYSFDPRNPVPFSWQSGTDRRPFQNRQDILVYTSSPLKTPVEIIGQVSVDLHASSSAKDTDFTAIISDVYPDGRSVYLGQKPVGIIRARYRQGFDKEVLLTPGKVEHYSIDLGHMAHRFLAGHSIRIEISSSAFPMFNPNQNSGNPVATDTEWKTATQKIFHDGDKASALVLPIVSR